MTGVHAPGPDPAQPKKPDTKDTPGDVYGGTWAPPEPPQKDSGRGSAPHAPKPKGSPDRERKAESRSFDPGSGLSSRMRRASAWWRPPAMGEHF